MQKYKKYFSYIAHKERKVSYQIIWDAATSPLFVWKHSEALLTGESRFHTSTRLGIEPRSLMTGSKLVVHWTSETWCDCSEITGSPQIAKILVHIHAYKATHTALPEKQP